MALQEDIEATLSSVTSKAGPSANLNVDNVNQGADLNMTPEMQSAYDQYQQANQPATGMLPLQQYYPGLNHNVVVGQTSDQFGSRALVAPGGGLVPLGILDARDKAIQAAALKKQADVDQFLKGFKAPVSKLVNINEENQAEYTKELERVWGGALKAAGGDASKAQFMIKSNPQLTKKLRTHENLAREGDAVFNKLADIENRVAKGEVVSQEIIDAKNKVLKSMNPDSKEFTDLSYNIRRLDAERELSDAMNEVAKTVFMQQNPGVWTDSRDPDFIKAFESSDKFYTKDNLDYIKQTLKDIHKGSTIYTPASIDKRVESWGSSHQKTINQSVQRKPEPEGGADFTYTDADFTKEPSSTNVYAASGVKRTPEVKDKEGNVISGGKVVKNAPLEDQITGEYGVKFKAPIETILPQGANLFLNDKENGMMRTSKVNPNANVQMFKTELVEVLDDDNPALKGAKGQPLNKTQLDAAKKAGTKTKWELMTQLNITEKVGDKTVSKTGWIPAKEVENSLVKQRDAKGNVIKGVPVDKQQAEADRRNAIKQTPDAKPTKKSDPLGLF